MREITPVSETEKEGPIPTPHSVPAKAPSTGGRLVYAIGDIHGHALVLDDLLRRIAADVEVSRPHEAPRLVFLGDYVDRGPDSRAVIDRILALVESGRFEVTALKGNHEDALLKFLDDPAYAPSWIENWGETTLRAYGIASPWREDGAAQARARFAAVFPDAHRAFLHELPLRCEIGDYLFVHAGVRPGVPLSEQTERDLMWIRYDFLESDADFGKVVVHGHTPAPRPQMRPNRIGIDTGVYYTGVLTAVRLEGESQRLIQAVER
ncbi:metallophosphoesterase family protein [Phenylobacterium sp. SCN 70-31]|uniref:metallophosphoesterase family protein n=1 Tax=Phenylobacterium sp. SCN 70-31 TaxID=1660129 RepID=UPI000AF1A8BD